MGLRRVKVSLDLVERLLTVGTGPGAEPENVPRDLKIAVVLPSNEDVVELYVSSSEFDGPAAGEVIPEFLPRFRVRGRE